MAFKLKVLTLNCWGVFMPLACKHKSERMLAIADELSKGTYDIVILQEIWTQSDYEKLCQKVLQIMPYTHYFHSGVFGSGVCIFSKHVINETFHHRFTLSGSAVKFFQGDWYCGKSVGLAKIQIQDLRINVYGTHLHAQYNEPDEHEVHRTIQSFELSQFIQHTSDGCDLVIVGGDFNFRPDQLGYNIIRFGGNLHDAWLSKGNKSETCHVEKTCDRPDNVYTSSAALKSHPKGVLLDYLMFRPNAGVDITCDSCSVTMQEVPGTPYHYSDHVGVDAVFSVKRNVTAMGKRRDSGEIEKHLSDALAVIDRGVKKTKSSQVFYLASILLAIFALIFSFSIDIPYDLAILFVAIRVVMFFYTVYCCCMCVVVTNCELTTMVAAKKDINNTLKAAASLG